MKLLLVALTLASGLLFNVFRSTEQKKSYEYTILSSNLSTIIGTDTTGKLVKTKFKNQVGFNGLDIDKVGESDQVIAAKLNEYSKAGWELEETVSTDHLIKFILKREKR